MARLPLQWLCKAQRARDQRAICRTSERGTDTLPASREFCQLDCRRFRNAPCSERVSRIKGNGTVISHPYATSNLQISQTLLLSFAHGSLGNGSQIPKQTSNESPVMSNPAERDGLKNGELYLRFRPIEKPNAHHGTTVESGS